jgi:hypothetical protein
VASSALPDSVLSYLNANYSGYVFEKGYEIKDSAGSIGGWVVIISFNGKPVGLLFDASGHFQRVLEQREGGDLEGEGWHHGGRFRDRDGSHRDTIALTALPSSISSYMMSNYPTDTLIRAFRNQDNSYLIISKDNGLFATLFKATGNFVKRVTIGLPGQFANAPTWLNIPQDSVPATGQNFLASTFPNYVFESAISVTLNGQIQGYVVIIDANNTKYAVWLDASGNPVAMLPVW